MVLTTLFLNDIRDAVKTEMETDWTHGAVGTGTTSATSSDTTLETELLRNAITETSSTTNTKTVSTVITSSQGNGSSLTEFGQFNASSGGTMWSRNTHTAVAKSSDLEVYYDITVTITVSET